MKYLTGFLMVSTLLASGCSTMQLGQANANLTQLYQEKSHADVYVQSAAREGLSALGREAGAAADKASDPQNKIAFYRIAVTAAWQAGDYQPINQYARAGQALCKSQNLDNRDCLMLLVFPEFAAIDETSEELKRIKPRCSAYSTECLNLYETTFNRYSGALARLIDHWPKVGAGSADPLFAPEVAKRMGEVTCEKAQGGIVGSLLQWHSADNETLRESAKSIRSQLKALLAQQENARISDLAKGKFSCRDQVNRD